MNAGRCSICDTPLSGMRSNAVYCSRKCKGVASERRRVRDDAARYQRERDHRRAYAVRYSLEKPSVGRASRARRKAMARQAGIFLVTARDWDRLCVRHHHRCFYCVAREPLTMDHVIPIIRGGRHSIGNLVPACVSCNSSKSRRFIMEWRAASAGRRSVALEAV